MTIQIPPTRPDLERRRHLLEAEPMAVKGIAT
jgi:hypothetical protein